MTLIELTMSYHDVDVVVVVDFGLASAETWQDFFLSMARLHRLCGGTGWDCRFVPLMWEGE